MVAIVRYFTSAVRLSMVTGLPSPVEKMSVKDFSVVWHTLGKVLSGGVTSFTYSSSQCIMFWEEVELVPFLISLG